MKQALSALAALLVFAAAAADVALTGLAPADFSVAILVDVRRMLGNREIQRTVASRGVAGTFAEMERAGVRVARIRELAVFFWDNHWYGAMRVEDAAAIRRDLERKCADPASNIVAETVAGNRVYRLKRPAKKDGRQAKKELCLFFPGDGTVVLAKAVEVEKFLTCPRLSPKAAAQLADTDAEVWCEYRGGAAAKTPDEERDSGFDLKLTRGFLEIRLAGINRRQVEVTGVGEFSDPADAKSMGKTLPGILAFFAGLIFAEDPEGGDELVRALRSEVDGGELLLSLKASEELFLRFLRAQETFFGGKKYERSGAAGSALRKNGKR